MHQMIVRFSPFGLLKIRQVSFKAGGFGGPQNMQLSGRTAAHVLMRSHIPEAPPEMRV